MSEACPPAGEFLVRRYVPQLAVLPRVSRVCNRLRDE